MTTTALLDLERLSVASRSSRPLTPARCSARRTARLTPSLSVSAFGVPRCENTRPRFRNSELRPRRASQPQKCQVTSGANYDRGPKQWWVTVFTQTDPQQPDVGSPYEASYVYGRNSPLVFTDPSGLRAAVTPKARYESYLLDHQSLDSPQSSFLNTCKADCLKRKALDRFLHCSSNGRPARCVYSRAVGNNSDDVTAINEGGAVEGALTFVKFKLLQLSGEAVAFGPVDWSDDGCSDGSKVTRSYGQPACLVHDFGYRNWFRIFPSFAGRYDEADCKKGSCPKTQIDDNFGHQWNKLCRDDDHWAYVCNAREKVIVRGVNGLGDLGKEPK